MHVERDRRTGCTARIEGGLVVPLVAVPHRVRHGDLPIRRRKAKIHAPNTAGGKLQAASAGAERGGGIAAVLPLHATPLTGSE